VPVKNSEWFNDSNFWEQFAPIMFDEAHWKEVLAVTDGITNLAGLDLYGENPNSLKSPPKVLDICCGFGRISAELARMGYEVTGVDITESYLKTAREEAAYENLEIEYIHSDAREFKRPEAFDLALNLYNSFGYFESQDDDLRLVRNVYNSLKKGGCFIIDIFGKEVAVRDFIESEWFERAGFMVLTKYKVLDAWTFLHNRWILIKDGKKYEKTFSYRLYSAVELKSLLLEAGFSKIDSYGEWDGSPYDQYANRLIVVARKL
jgi:SAM-dependent methyltransferase